jgi:hypothetical protein
VPDVEGKVGVVDGGQAQAEEAGDGQGGEAHGPRGAHDQLVEAAALAVLDHLEHRRHRQLEALVGRQREAGEGPEVLEAGELVRGEALGRLARQGHQVAPPALGQAAHLLDGAGHAVDVGQGVGDPGLGPVGRGLEVGQVAAQALSHPGQELLVLVLGAVGDRVRRQGQGRRQQRGDGAEGVAGAPEAQLEGGLPGGARQDLGAGAVRPLQTRVLDRPRRYRRAPPAAAGADRTGEGPEHLGERIGAGE